MDCDVIVVGAGPVGLWLAAEARSAGARVVVLERRERPIRQSRALTIHGRTLEIFGLRGLAPKFLDVGQPIDSWHFAGLDTRLDFTGFDSPHPYTLFIPQSRTEHLLREHALEVGVEIRTDVTVTAVMTDDDHVRVTDAEGAVLTGRFAVGADGARSVVRTSMGISFPGLAATDTIAMGDVILDLPGGRPFHSAANENGGGNVIPSGDGIHSRVIILDDARRTVAQSEPLTIEELAESARRTMGSDFGMRDASWLSRFTNETRLASSYRAGRVFLAGDAAHIHAPMGGQGLNVGVQDAANLGWKLGAVVTGQAPEAVLNTYERERRPIGERLFTNTVAQAKLISMLDPASGHLREVVSGLLAVPEANRAMAGEVSGFSIAYPDPLLDDIVRTSLTGRRVPDVPITNHSTATSLHAELRSGNWLRVTRPGREPIPVPASLSPAAITDIVGVPTRPGLLDDVASMIVRPDGYVLLSQGSDDS